MSVGAAPRSRRTGIVMVGLRIALGVLFLTVWGSNVRKGFYGADQYAGLPESRAYSLDELVLGRPPLDRLPAWVRG